MAGLVAVLVVMATNRTLAAVVDVRRFTLLNHGTALQLAVSK